jgi:hypothetical protein
MALSHKNFSLIGTKNKALGITLPGLVLVYFKIEGDENCIPFDPVFKELRRIDTRVKYGILDLNQNKNVVAWSRETSTPINVVPLLILYINGLPHAKFAGNRNVKSVQQIITDALRTQNNNGPRNGNGNGNNNMYDTGNSDEDTSNRKTFMPEIGRAPSMKGALKNGGGGGNNYNSIEDDDDPKLTLPPTVIPWNVPWESDT